MLLIFLLLLSFESVGGKGFVEEVTCNNDSLTIFLNQSDPDLTRWIMEPSAQPIIYVYDHINMRSCNSKIKNETTSLNWYFRIPYGPECNVNLVDLEPNHRSAETTVVIEDLNSRNSQRINHVYCLYQKVTAALNINDVTSGNKQVESTGGIPKAKVEMLFRGHGGHPLRAAKLGDIVEFYVALSPDGAYRGISPKECRFADREDTESPDAKHFTFVNDGCPVEGTGEVIDALQNVNQEVYFSKFKTFRFGEQTTVFAHCTVQVCMDPEECYSIQNSTLTAERLRKYRHKRSTGEHYDKSGELHLINRITVLDAGHLKEIAALNEKNDNDGSSECKMVPYSANSTMLTVIAILTVFSLSLMTIIIFMYYKKRKSEKDSFDLYASTGYATAASWGSTSVGHVNAALATPYPIDAFSVRNHPYVHHLGDGDGTFR
ncbi:unnamed protein product, partial [Mesorhabditis belari]|uniref:ZP domain-containing protein n=1 Tax=Mesorhabditis belari TaxID=2138241 RepID=A0AAF3ECN2_9BILA